MRHGQQLRTKKNFHYLSHFRISRCLVICDGGGGIYVNSNVPSLTKCIYKQCIGFGPIISLKKYFKMHFGHLSFFIINLIMSTTWNMELLSYLPVPDAFLRGCFGFMLWFKFVNFLRLFKNVQPHTKDF